MSNETFKEIIERYSCDGNGADNGVAGGSSRNLQHYNQK